MRAVSASFSYGTHPALVDVTFTVPAGVVTAVVGPNGSGKSTLLHGLAGLLTPRSGHLEVLGGTPDSRRRRIAYVLQAASVSEALPITVREVVAMGRYGRLGILRRPRADDRDAVDRALALLELEDLADRQLRDLSGGQRQRTFVAQGVAQDADLLLLDEPVTGLDMVSRQAILDTVRRLCRDGRTVVLTTHDLDEAAGADEVLVLAGRVVASGPPREVLVPDVLRRAYGGRLMVFDGGSLLVDDPHHHAPGVDHSLCADDDEVGR